ncbi:MAG: HNH endonuclease [Gammaproteobacteria bacterium]
MRCIFCNVASDAFISQEHIVPESLGNTEHVLPRGWVCDKCNNYFAREVEKPFLDSLYGRCSRFEMAIANKKGRIPRAAGIHAQWRTKIEIFEIECQGRA